MPYPNLPFDWANQFERTIGGGESGYDAQAAADAAYPVPPVPQMVPQSRFQSGLDAASLAVLQQLQNMPQPRGFGAGLAQGFAGGLAQTRAERVAEKKSAFESEQANRAKQVERNAAAKFTAGRDLARRRWDMVRAQQPKQSNRLMTRLSTGEEVPYTATIANQRAIDAGDIPRRERAGRDPDLAELTRLTIEQKKREAEERASAIDDAAVGIGTFKSDPRLPAREPDRQEKINRVNAFLAGPNAPKKPDGSSYNHRELVQLREEADRFSRVMNSARPTQLRQSAITAHEHLKQMEEFYNRYWDLAQRKMNDGGVMSVVSKVIPKELRESNKAVLWMAQNGYLGPQAAEDASSLVSTGDPLRREVELVFSSGYAPYEAEMRNGFKKLDEARGPRGFAGQLRAIRGLIRKRVEIATKAIPFYGGEGNPYLLGVSPIGAWLEAEKGEPGSMADIKKPEATELPKAGGKAGRYSQ